MIPREHFLKFVLAATIVSVAQSQNSRAYDTNDWIPITNKCPTCYENENKEHHVIEKKATGRVLNLADADPSQSRFFPEEQTSRSKNSNRGNVQQYLREISPPSKKLPKRQHEILQQQPLELRGIPADIQQQLNQGEFVNQQYFRQRQPHQQVQLANPGLLQPTPQLHPGQLVVQPGQPYFAGNQQFAPRPLFDIPVLPDGLNAYQPGYQNVAPGAQRPNNLEIGKYEELNPGIQEINRGLAGESLANSNINNNYKNLKQISLTSTSPKPAVEKESVQLLYVPLETLNQRQQQIQQQQAALLQQEQQAAAVQQAQLQEEQQLRARQDELQRLQQDQQLKARQQLQLKAQKGEELKAQRELEQRAQEELQLKAQQEQQIKAQQEEVFLQQQLQQQQVAFQPQLQAQNQQTLLLQQQPLQAVQFIEPTPRSRRPTRPQIKQQYHSRVSSPQTESPLEHKQIQLQSIQNDFAQQALSALKLQYQLQQEPSPVQLSQPSSTTTVQTPTTQATAKKRKPHQPPLAVYMEGSGAIAVSDVLNVLKNAKSISVQDSVGPHSPQVFVGPHNLEPPEGYAKFELPYLSAIENNRVERKVDQLPFFVAPLSYRTPPGYSKIPLPAPHVGSVVISQPEQLPEKHTREQPPYRLENLLSEDQFRLPNQQTYLLEQQPRPVKPFRLENAINEAPFRLPAHTQQILDPFSSPLVTPPPLVPVTSRPDLLGQTINQYELQQINNQFLPQPQPQLQAEYQSAQLQGTEPNEYEEAVTVRQQGRKSNRIVSTTPTVIASRAHPVTEVPQLTTRRSEYRSRRPTQRTTVSTQSNVDKTRYTVLEEFTAKQGPTTANAVDYNEETIVSSTPSSTSQIYSANLSSRRQQAATSSPEPQPLSLAPQPASQQLLPSSVSQLVPQPALQSEGQLALQQATRQQPTSQQPLQQPLQQVLNQDILDSQILQQQGIPAGSPGVQTYYQIDSNGNYFPVQTIDENAYKLMHQQQFEQEVEAFRQGVPINSTPAPTKETVTTTVRLTERPTELPTTRANVRGGSRSRTRGRTQYVPEVYDESSEEKTKEVENYKLPAELPSIHPGIHSLINDLQDQAVRPLLAPASIAPTTEHASRASSQRQREQFASISPVQQLQQELATRAPVQQQRQQFAQLSPVLQLEQELALQTPVQQREQFTPHPQVQQLEQELASQPQLQQRPQLSSLSPVEQLQQQIVTEPSIEQQQQQQFVSQQVQQLEQQFRTQQVEPQFVSQSPTQQLEPQYVLVASTEAEPLSTTTSPSRLTYPLTTAAPIETTTSSRRQRGRQRARVSTTTPSARATTQRARRPTSRTRTDINRYQQELEDYVDYTPVRATDSRTRESIRQQQVDYDTEAPRRSPSRQRSRTRGRPQQEIQQLTERTISTSVADENTFRQPQLQSGFQASGNPLLQPQSYMQFEQPFELVPQREQPRVQVITADRNQILKQYPVYSNEQQLLTSTEELPISTKKAISAEPQKLSVDVLITHPITESATREPVILSQAEEDSPYVRFSSNVESSGRGHTQQESEEVTTRASQARVRGRGRGRARTKTTPRPTTTTVSHVRTTTEEHEEEFYGFIRPPNYNRPPPSQHRAKEAAVEPKLYSATYLSSTGKPLRVPSNSIGPQYEDQPPENSNTVPIYSKNAISTTPRVQFVGKLRPKFQPSTVRHPESAEVTTEEITTEKRFTIRTTRPTYNPKAKIRGRTRQTTKRPQSETTRAIAQKPVRTPPSEAKGHRFKPRGTSSFQVPDNLKSKTEDDDVAGGNYPAPFLKAQEDLTERPKFQITIDPGLEENQSDEDQLPYSSIYRPKIVRNDATDVTNGQGSSELNYLPLHNDIPIDRKNVESQEHSTPVSVAVAKETLNGPENNDTFLVKSIMEEFMGDVEETSENDEIVSSSSSNPIDSLDSKEEAGLDTNNKSKSRRRGVWRLVKRPVDTFEAAESQYVGSVIANSFITDEKKSTTKGLNNKFSSDNFNNEYSAATDNQKQIETSTTAEYKEATKLTSQEVEVTPQPSESYSSKTTENFFESLYKMFGMEEESQKKETGADDKDVPASDNVPQIAEGDTQSESFYAVPVNPFEQTNESDALVSTAVETRLNNLSAENETNQGGQIGGQLTIQNILLPPVLTDAPIVSPSPSHVLESLEPKIEPWDFGVKTSTSTEVSHETEICYRGRCVKSSGTKIPTL